MIDGILNRSDFPKRKKEGLVEVGCGSGAVILTLSDPAQFNITIDRNFEAAVQTAENARINNLSICVVAGYLLTPFRRDGLPKTILFNPPYLPEDPEFDPYLSKADRLALIGGKKGDETAWKLVEGLEPTQEAFVIFSTIATNVTEIEMKAEELEVKWELVATLSLGLENLLLVHFKSQKE
ncbi:MAG: hypothetical protein D6732_15490 [Methanobacteriota archaeon]|nr:MAG: hypothetical protein D6732_15490 [Euryarchaeota archaeon]